MNFSNTLPSKSIPIANQINLYQWPLHLSLKLQHVLGNKFSIFSLSKISILKVYSEARLGI